MVNYTKPQQGKKQESETIKGEGDQIKFIDLRFERWQVVGFRKARRQAYVNCISVRSINCTFLGSMMIWGTEFVDYAVKLGKGVNELSFWCFFLLSTAKRRFRIS